jgi:hypothetical protein
MKKNNLAVGIHRIWILAFAMTACLWGGTAILAQDAAQQPGGWHYGLDIYGWGTGLSGSVGPNDNQQQVKENFSGIVSYLDMAFMAHFEANNGTWGIIVDPYYVDLGDSTTTGAGYPVNLDLKQFMGGLAGTYRLYRSPQTIFDLTFGLRYNELRLTINPYVVPSQHKSVNWTDPVIGFKGGVQMSKAWSFGYRADVGGFGAGSRLTWSGVVRFDAKVSKTCSLGFGYIYYYVDYEENAGRQDLGSFVYDMAQAGPFLGVGFHW